MAILIVDDDVEFLGVLEEMFSLRVPGVPVVSCESAFKALQYMRQHRFEIAFVDLRLDGISGAEVLRALRLVWPAARVFLMSVHRDFEAMRSCIELGGAGYLLKGDSLELFVNAIATVDEQHVILSKDLTHALVDASSDSILPGSALKGLGFKATEREILKLIGSGLSNEEIAESLGFSISNVKRYVRDLSRLFSVSNRTQLLAEVRKAALRNGASFSVE